jgi:hypothetical protein
MGEGWGGGGINVPTSVPTEVCHPPPNPLPSKGGGFSKNSLYSRSLIGKSKLAFGVKSIISFHNKVEKFFPLPAYFSM